MAERMSLHYNRNYPPHLGMKAAVLIMFFGATAESRFLIVAINAGTDAVLGSQVQVSKRVDAVLGKNVTLGCRVQVESNLSLTQSTWERKRGSATVTVAVYNPQFGISVAPEYEHRLSFRSPSTHDATITLQDVGFADSGVYICKVATFPLGNTQAATTLSVMVEPKIYVSAGSVPLLDGGNETLVATCTAEKARPPAEVIWETGLSGRSEASVREELNGTSTTQVRYTWRPVRHAHGHALTCVVRHPALQRDFRIPYQLNVQSAPDIVLGGYHGDWFVGQENAELQCRADANPPPRSFTWSRLGGGLPDSVEVVNNHTLVFLRPLQLNDSGLYRCEVGNDIGLRARDFDIRIQHPPSTTTLPPTTPAPVHTTVAAAPPAKDLTPTKGRAHFTSPTLAPIPEGGSLGTIIGGAVGGALFLLLLLVLGGACYRKQQQTFRGDYYTKQYLGPSDMQKTSQPSGGSAPKHAYELQEVYGGGKKEDEDLKPKPANGDDVIIQRDRDLEEWGDTRRSQREVLGYHANHNHTNHNHGSPRRLPQPHSPRPHPHPHPHHHHPPMYRNHHAPYLPPTDDCCYDNSLDSDFVSHVDGSVISRREWYV